MRVLIVSCVFPPEPVVSSQTTAQITRKLVERGHQVTVITSFPSRPGGKLYPAYQRKFLERKPSPEGYLLVRCFSFLSGESHMLSRFLENISFGISAGWALLTEPRPDVVYSIVWPLFAEGIVLLVARLRGIPIVLSKQDMYPESLAVQGRVRPDQWLYKLFLWLDRWIARKASALIVISESFAKNYVQIRGIEQSKITIIPNWIDSKSVTVQDKNDYRQEKGISNDAFVILYGGNVGVAAGVEMVIEALGRVRTSREIVLIVAGSGSQLSACQELAAQVSNVRVVFHTPWATEETSKTLAAADVLILPTRGKQSLASVPSKLLSYLLAARPVLAMVLPESDTARMVEEAACGWVVMPDDGAALTQKIEELTVVPEEVLVEMGVAGRAYALQHFTDNTCLPIAVQVIEKAAKEEHGRD